MCNSRATSKEHIPPKVFFPKIQELPDGNNYRKNLIRVPSCDRHNTNKSGYDLYVHTIIVTGLFSNIVAQQHFDKDTMPRMRKKPELYKIFLKNTKPVIANGLPSISYEIEKDKIDYFFTCLAKGLYYKEFGNKWNEKLWIEYLNIFRGSKPEELMRDDRERGYLRTITRKFFESSIKKGENPQVFYYQVHEEKPFGYMFRIVFYEKFSVLIIPKSSMKEEMKKIHKPSL